MPFAFNRPVVGVGSMCRRHVEGDHGVIRIVEELDRAFSGTKTRFHLFGLKSQAMAALRGHERIGSCDSQAYGVRARKAAHRHGIAKTNDILAAHMKDRLRQQQSLLTSPGYVRLKLLGPLPAQTIPDLSTLDKRIAAAAEELRELHEAGVRYRASTVRTVILTIADETRSGSARDRRRAWPRCCSPPSSTVAR